MDDPIPWYWFPSTEDVPIVVVMIVILWCSAIFVWQAKVIVLSGSGSSQLNPDEIEELVDMTGFTSQQIRMLYKRFKRLDKDNSGSISSEEFQSIPELAMNPLFPRIMAVFDQDGTDSVNFSRFVRIMSVFRPDADREDKTEFAFRIYDIDGDGYITKAELFEVLKMCVGPNIKEKDLEKIVDQTIQEADILDKDGRISRAEFAHALECDDVNRKLSIRFDAGYVSYT